MSLFDNRVHLNDCEDNNQVSADTTAAPTAAVNDAGAVIEGTNSIAFQCADAQEVVLWEDNSAGTLINFDASDVTVYMNVKHNLGESFANLGGQIAFGDGLAGSGAEVIGYNVVGNDVAGFPYLFRFTTIKLDVSVIVASPGTEDVDYFVYIGTTESSLDHTAVLQIGYGTFNVEKVVSTGKNAWMDGIYYIANSVSAVTGYAVSIEGGTIGTPETMVDVIADDIAVGMGLFNNPKGSEFGFFGPTQWGDGLSGDTFFTSTGEQWYFIGDNAGGHVVAAGHFLFRLVGFSSSTNSWVLVSTVIVNTGRRAPFDMSNADMDTATMDGCTLIGFDTIELPNAGTAKTTLNCIFSDCGIITSNGGDMTGSSVLTPAVSANEAGLVWNENADPDGELDNMTFTKTSAVAHHAITFGLDIPTSEITLRGCAFGTDFSATDDGSTGDETFHFLDTGGTLTVNLVQCTGNFGYRTEGVVITKVVDPVTTKLTIEEADGTPIENARVFLETDDNGGGGGFPYQAATSALTQAAGTATLDASAVHGLVTGDKVVIRNAGVENYNSVVTITVTDTDSFTFPIDSGAGSPAGGTPIFSYVPIQGLTDSNGEIQSSRVWPASQGLVGYGRKSSATPFFKQTAISIADASGGTDLLVALQPDGE